ncbi:hypothetical protein AAFF_G00426850 [Aldrovandia affinis]|uniref:Uncharacterized protein n=1 Tax=Aldrovandia affinis TaxID=143900 RepID=A0AAD7WJ00_9TELE|nr:hypothetical protein AAFF_G00426850 [Aldrovandia affinis]
MAGRHVAGRGQQNDPQLDTTDRSRPPPPTPSVFWDSCQQVMLMEHPSPRGQGTRIVQLPPKSFHWTSCQRTDRARSKGRSAVNRQPHHVSGATWGREARGAALLKSTGQESRCPLRRGFGFGCLE